MKPHQHDYSFKKAIVTSTASFKSSTALRRRSLTIAIRSESMSVTLINNSECYVVAEIGINHNGNLETAKQLIKVAHDAGCNAVKFQKRTIDKVYTKEQLDSSRESPWGATTREQKEGLEFGEKEYDEIDNYCKKNNLEVNPNQINIKGKTTEKLGLIGKGKAIASEVITSVIKYD